MMETQTSSYYKRFLFSDKLTESRQGDNKNMPQFNRPLCQQK